MKKVVFLMGVIMASSASFAYKQIKCAKNGDIWKAEFHEQDRSSIFGLYFNDNYNENGKFDSSAGLKKYIEILQGSNKCRDISGYVSAGELGLLLQCDGEIFATRFPVYGQVFLSVGAIELFKNVLAPASSWTCEYI